MKGIETKTVSSAIMGLLVPPRAMAVRILIADDDASIRRLLRRLIENHGDWTVCGDALNGQDAVFKASELTPDVIVLDLAMPEMNGLQAAREISRTRPELPMLLLTVQNVSKELTTQAAHAGFRGAVSKSTGSEVVRGIETLLQHRSFFQTSRSEHFAWGFISSELATTPSAVPLPAVAALHPSTTPPTPPSGLPGRSSPATVTGEEVHEPGRR
jgi:DNA-binding NarL/FixJ family response regulator